MQTNRLHFPPLELNSNGLNKSAHFYLVKTVWKRNLSRLMFVLTGDVISLVPEHRHAGERGQAQGGGGRHTRGPVP